MPYGSCDCDGRGSNKSLHIVGFRKGALAVNAGRQRLPTDAMVAFRFQDLATGLVLKLVIFTDPVVT